MPVAVEKITPLPVCEEPSVRRIRWTRQKCDALREAGILTGRYELIDGEIFLKVPQNPPHRIALILLRGWFVALFGNLRVQDQSSIVVADQDSTYNEPEPDIAVTKEPATFYRMSNPGPGDFELIAEVADTSVRFERTTKALLYARAGVSEYWVVDIPMRRVIVHRAPSADGYGDIAAYAEGEDIATLALPDQTTKVAELLPPVEAAA